MNIGTKIMTALKAGWQAFTEDAETVKINSERADFYNLAWAYYKSSVFSRSSGFSWAAYIESRQLYTHTRLIYNPVPEIVDFYVDNIWQHSYNEKYPMMATPMLDTSPEKVMKAVEVLDQWGNWSTEALKIKRYAAASGGVLVEGVRDFDRQKILHKTIWGGYVTRLDLNDQGDVLGYTLEYKATDPRTGEVGQFKKIVTREQTAYYLNDSPYTPPGLNRAAVEPNPLGFCFAVWLKHSDDGTAAMSNYDKVDEANSLASHLHDNIHKLVESPVVIATDGTVKVISGGVTNPDGTVSINDPRLDWVVMKVPTGGSVLDLASKLKLAESHPYLKDLLASFSEDYPELQARSIIMNSAEMSGAALDRKMTPAQNRLDRAAANYNRQLIKFKQMQISAGAYAARNEWTGANSRQQAVFSSFTLDSYERGDLDFNVRRSMLIETTETEAAELLGLKLDNANKASGIVPLEQQIIIAGYSEEEATEFAGKISAEAASMPNRLGMTDGANDAAETNDARLLNA